MVVKDELSNASDLRESKRRTGDDLAEDRRLSLQPEDFPGILLTVCKRHIMKRK